MNPAAGGLWHLLARDQVFNRMRPSRRLDVASDVFGRAQRLLLLRLELRNVHGWWAVRFRK